MGVSGNVAGGLASAASSDLASAAGSSEPEYPLTTLGSQAAAIWDRTRSDIVLVDGAVDSVSDYSGNGHTITAPSAARRPAIDARDIIHDGISGVSPDTLRVTSMTIAEATLLQVWGVFRSTTASPANTTAMWWSSSPSAPTSSPAQLLHKSGPLRFEPAGGLNGTPDKTTVLEGVTEAPSLTRGVYVQELGSAIHRFRRLDGETTSETETGKAGVSVPVNTFAIGNSALYDIYGTPIAWELIFVTTGVLTSEQVTTLETYCAWRRDQ